MNGSRIGVRELKARLSEYLRRVKAGHTIVITEHGRTVGRIVPAGQSLDERLQGMRQAGALAWSGKRSRRVTPLGRARGGAVADLLVENRG